MLLGIGGGAASRVGRGGGEWISLLRLEICNFLLCTLSRKTKYKYCSEYILVPPVMVLNVN